MSRGFLISALLCTVCILIPSCGSQTASSGGTGGAKTGGATSASGGNTAASGGTTEGSGGVTTASGGNTVANGGTTRASGGSTTANGGATTAQGGTTTANGGAQTGGTSGGGGMTTASGGTTTASGGSSTATGGKTTATGGATPGTGGATAATGGTTAATGGTPGTGGATATGTGGATAIGGTTGAAGSTGGGLEVWVSPTGDDANPGTKDSPMFSICYDDNNVTPNIKQGACYKLCPAGTGCNAAGGTIWVMDGTYKYKAVQKIGSSKLGTASGPFNIFAVAGAKPVLDFSALPVDKDSRGLQLGGDYWHAKGLTITKAGDTGIFVMGNNNTVEQCIAHHNQDAGMVVGVNKDRAGSGKNNLFLNCDSYQNNDEATNGANADGFGAKENTGGTGNIFRGCRAWDNADDGFDFYGWADPITVDNCWAMSNSKTLGGSKSNGNGFKLGGNSVSAAHILKDLYATDNKYAAVPGNCGFTNNSNPASMTCTGTCASWDNSRDNQNIAGVSTTAPSGATAAKMIAAQRKADGSLPAITAL